MELQDFLTYTKLDLKREDKDTEITQAYNDMIVWVAVQIPHGNYKFQSYVNTVVGVEDYALPPNIIHLLHPVRLLLGAGTTDSGFSLEHLTKEEYDIIEPNPNRSSPSTGRPGSYAVFSRSILLTPVPDRATYVLEINWTKRPTTLSADDDRPDLGSEWDEVLKWGTLERVYAGLGQWDESTLWGNKYHAIAPNGDDMSVGMCKKLFDNERDSEDRHIGQVESNDF